MSNRQTGDLRLLRPDASLLGEMQDAVADFFPFPISYYTKLSAADYRACVALAQGFLNSKNLAARLIRALRTEISDYLGSADILVQSNLYLRAARPVEGQESVGWHRESFYGTPQRAVNFWMPVRDVTAENTIQYIPDSDLIPDDHIETVTEEDAATPRHSDGHKIGLLYEPKRIVSGVDLSIAKPMVVPMGSAVLFPGSLIHGAAINHTDRIRFSIDFRLLAKEHLTVSKKHFGQDYFIPLEAA